MQFVLTKEKQEADRKRVEAQGIADYQKIISLNLTDKQLQYEMIKAQKEIALSPQHQGYCNQRERSTDDFESVTKAEKGTKFLDNRSRLTWFYESGFPKKLIEAIHF